MTPEFVEVKEVKILGFLVIVLIGFDFVHAKSLCVKEAIYI